MSIAGTPANRPGVVLSAGLALAGTSAASAGSKPPPPPTFTIVPGGQGQGHGEVAATKGLTQVKSDNWSGYADTGKLGYSRISSSWTQPKVTCDASITGYQQVSFWDGIDGYNNGQVEQGGTDAYCYGGQGPFYDTWWEHFPVNNEQVVGTTVQAGDKITASVVRSGTNYTVKITDSTHPANSFTHSFTCAAKTCTDTSAEWIAEAPGGDNTASGLYPLAKFAPWTNSNSAVSAGTGSSSGTIGSSSGASGTLKSFPDHELTMVGAGNVSLVKAKPGPLNSAGTTFSVTWENAGP